MMRMRAVGRNGRILPGRLATVPRRGRRLVGAQCTAGYPYIKPAFDLGHEEVMEIQLEVSSQCLTQGLLL